MCRIIAALWAFLMVLVVIPDTLLALDHNLDPKSFKDSVSVIGPGEIGGMDINQVKYRDSKKIMGESAATVIQQGAQAIDRPAAQGASNVMRGGRMVYDAYQLRNNIQTRPNDPSTALQATGFGAGVVGAATGSAVVGGLGTVVGPLRRAGEIVRSCIITGDTLNLIKPPGGAGQVTVQGTVGSNQGQLSYTGSGLSGNATWKLSHTPQSSQRTMVVNYSYDRDLAPNGHTSGQTTVRQKIVEDYGTGLKGVVNRITDNPSVRVSTTKNETSQTRETVTPPTNNYNSGSKNTANYQNNIPSPSYDKSTVHNNRSTYQEVQTYNSPSYKSYDNSFSNYNHNQSYNNTHTNSNFNTHNSNSFNIRMK